jgi:hypothetical protein
MSTHSRLATAASVIAFTLSLGHAGAARAQAASSRYPTAAPIEQYRSKSQAEEIALARSAAPASISANAEVLVLGDHGYETAVKGTNGFVCFVERSWAAGFDDPEFWNPKLRAPNCFNATAARTELRQLRTRTEWVLAGVGRQEIIERTRSAYANHTFKSPEPGALTYMLKGRLPQRRRCGAVASAPDVLPSARPSASVGSLRGRLTDHLPRGPRDRDHLAPGSGARLVGWFAGAARGRAARADEEVNAGVP